MTLLRIIGYRAVPVGGSGFGGGQCGRPCTTPGPFVYRLGQQVFILQRRVRFPQGSLRRGKPRHGGRIVVDVAGQGQRYGNHHPTRPCAFLLQGEDGWQQ